MQQANSVNLIILGFGKVGRALVRQILANPQAFNTKGLTPKFTALADSRAALVGMPLSTAQIEAALAAKEAGQSLADLPGAIALADLPEYFNSETIVIDTSAAKASLMQTALEKGSRLVFANKNNHSAPWERAAAFFNSQRVKYESTVGAGLPVIRSLQGLVNTGDPITRIEGVMSGTLGYLCSQLEQGSSYSQAVQQAKDLGYTEPDPRDDLSGFDVARKALILARTAGWPLEMSDLSVEAFYSPELATLSVPDFMAQMHTLDAAYAEKVQAAAEKGEVLRYMAEISPRGGRVGLVSVLKSSPLGALNGPGNYVAFYSERYAEIPLVISGPGAGIEVTAAGVFSDLIDLL